MGLLFHDSFIINTDANLEGSIKQEEEHKSRNFLPIGVCYIDKTSVHLERVRAGGGTAKSFQFNVYN